MAQWQKLQELSSDGSQVFQRVSEILKDTGLTTEVRNGLAEWIESKKWSDYKSNSKSKEVFQEMIRLMREMENDPNTSFVDKLKWGQEIQKIQESFTAPDVFVKSMEDCLKNEKLLIQSCESSDDNRKRKTKRTIEMAQRNHAVDNKIIKISQDLQAYEKDVSDLESKQEGLFLEIPTIKTRLSSLEKLMKKPPSGRTADSIGAERMETEQDLKNKVLHHYEHRKLIGNNHVTLATSICYLLKDIWQEIGKWQKDQKLEIAALSKPKEGIIDILEEICEKGAYLLVSVIRQITRVLDIYEKRPYNNDSMVGVLQQTLNELQKDYLKEHLNKVAVVERNVTNQILKVTTGRSAQFSMMLRVLGGRSLGLEHAMPKVTARLYHENKLQDMLREAVPMDESVCKIANSENKLMEFKNRCCIAQFANMQLSNLRRNERGNKEELVTEQKYGVIFFMDVQVLGQTYTVKSLSLPIILTSQTSQECMAKGTLIWDAAFSKDERTPFQCRDQVTWPEVANILNAQFNESTGKQLKPQQLNYLARIVFKSKKAIDYDNKKITDKELIRDKLLPRDFSFWKWFWACLNLVKADKLKADWQEDKIYGFISKIEAEECLKGSPNGTFLLRFSEQTIEQSQRATICGHLTVAVVETSPETGCQKVFYVKQNLTPQELTQKGLYAILDSYEITDFENNGKKKPLLTHLYPDTASHFSSQFQHYGGRDNPIADSGGYKTGKFKVEIFLTRPPTAPGNNVVFPLSPSHSIDIAAPSPASFVSVNNDSPPAASPGFSDMHIFDEENMWNVPDRQVPMAQVQPLTRISNNGSKRTCVAVPNSPMSGNGMMSPQEMIYPNTDQFMQSNVVIEHIPQLSDGTVAATNESLGQLQITEDVIREFLDENGTQWPDQIMTEAPSNTTGTF